jgi:hypothetical protein
VLTLVLIGTLIDLIEIFLKSELFKTLTDQTEVVNISNSPNQTTQETGRPSELKIDEVVSQTSTKKSFLLPFSGFSLIHLR